MRGPGADQPTADARRLKNGGGGSVYRLVEERVSALAREAAGGALCGGLKGIEKESLRITPDGRISPRPHPAGLGAALTNRCITTDFSEALLELVTPPCPGTEEALGFLADIHRFVYANIGDEALWATSMPCAVRDETSVPIARYGTSNVGRMKHIYRVGLSYRYGRVMQAISGVHFNYSLPDAFWPVYMAASRRSGRLQGFIDEAYFALLRNFHRCGWLTLYLFGASPALCKSFLCGRPSDLESFDDYTLFAEHATCLRMSDIGYSNKNQASVGISVNSLDEYIVGLESAVSTPHAPYEAIGVIVDGERRQLNANLLQIENEYYSLIRPKRVAYSGERPTHALRRGGVQYVEVRALDVSAVDAIGVNLDQLRFLEAFLVFCLLAESPPVGALELEQLRQNQLAVARNGRDPALALWCGDRMLGLSAWASEILDAMEPVCALLDASCDGHAYTRALAVQREKVVAPELTPSARILAAMRAADEPFFRYALEVSLAHRNELLGSPYEEPARLESLRREAAASHERQREIEAADELDFESYLARYFA